jgi:hypothetical protein
LWRHPGNSCTPRPTSTAQSTPKTATAISLGSLAAKNVAYWH